MDQKLLTRGIIAGVVLAVLGIGMFLLLWTVLEDADTFVRLVISVCVPPAILAGVGGGLILMIRPKDM